MMIDDTCLLKTVHSWRKEMGVLYSLINCLFVIAGLKP